MKKMNTINHSGKAIIVFALVISVILPSIAMAMTTTQADQKTPNFLSGQNTKQYHVTSISSYVPSTTGMSRGDDDVRLTGTWNTGDNVIPSITMDSQERVIVAWTNIVDPATSNMGFVYSDDPANPSSWLGGTYGLTGGPLILSYNQIAFITGRETGDYSGLYGTYLGIDTEQAGVYTLPDITDNTGWLFYTWNSATPAPMYAAVTDSPYYHQPNSFSGVTPYWGPVNMYLYEFIQSPYDIQDCPVYVNNNLMGGTGASSAFYFDAQSHLLTAPAKDPDVAGLDTRFHLAWQYHNDTSGRDQIVWKKIDPEVEADIEYTPFQKYVAFGTHPAIAGQNNGKIAIVYAGETGKVNCTYSGDDGQTWLTSTIATGSYPDIYYRSGKFYAAYIDAGNLFMVNSTDGGATWGAATRINDADGTVVAEENSVALHEGGIVWVDNRNGALDLYYQKVFVKAPVPKLEMAITAATGLGVKASITNSGTAAATNVNWEIKVIGGVLGRINVSKTGTIASLAPAETKTVSTGLFFGLGTISITSSATCDEGKSAHASGEGTQFIIFTIVK